MANEIKDKFTSSAALTITIASLASSTAGVGRQSTIVDNSTTRYQKIKVFAQIKLGTSPSANTAVYLYALRGDQNGYRTDNAGASDAALTVLNAPLLGIMRAKSSPSTGDVLYGDFDMITPGLEWGVCIVQDTGAALDATAGSHFIHWIGVDPEVQ